MTSQPGVFRQYVGRALALLIVTYVITIGGAFTGIVIPGLRQTSLALLTLVVIGWLLVFLRHPGDHLPHPAVLFALAVWALAYANSALRHPSSRVWIGTWFAALYAGAWLAMLDIQNRGAPGRWIIDAALIATVPVMLLALIQIGPWFAAWAALDRVEVVFVPPRPSSTLGNPNVLGSMLAALLPFGLIRMRWAQRRPDRVLAGLWCMLAAAVLFLTYSRGSWFAAVAGVSVLGVALARQSTQRRRLGALSALPKKTLFSPVWLLISVTVAVIVSGSVLLWSSDAFDTPRRTTSPRFAYYRIAWDVFRDHPLTGTGPFTFGLYQSAAQSIPPEQPHSHAHNLILNVAAEFGLPGLFALAVSAGLLGWRAWNMHKLQAQNRPAQHAEAAAGSASLAVFAVHALFDMPMIVPAVMLLFIALWASAFDWREWHGPPGGLRLWRVSYSFGVTLLWMLSLGIGWWTSRTYNTYVAGERMLIHGDYDNAVRLLQQAANRQPANPLYWAEYGYACGLAAANGNPAYLQPGIRAYEKALTLERPHATWWANLAALYWQAGEHETAIHAMRQAAQFAPNAPDIWINLGLYLEESNRRADAIQAYIAALEASPAWGISSFWDETALRKRVRKAHMGGPIPYVQAEEQWQAGDLHGGIRILEATIENDPSQPRPYFSIARLYVHAGQYDAARDNLAAARVLAHSDLDWAWINAVEAELALAEGNEAAWTEKLSGARARLWPDATGHPIYYGQDIANLQFLSLKVKGSLLPQIVVLGPDPLLVDLLRTDS